MLRLPIATLKKQVFGPSSEKIEREIEQLELALEDLPIATAESDVGAADDDQDENVAEPPVDGDAADRPSRRRPRVSESTPRERQELDPNRAAAPIVAAICAWWGKKSARCWISPRRS